MQEEEEEEGMQVRELSSQRSWHLAVLGLATGTEAATYHGGGVCLNHGLRLSQCSGS